MLQEGDVLSYLADRNIEWTFTTELAPWQGGVYERQVGMVKNTMRTEIGRKLLKFDTFITLLTEVEAVVNSRPITYVYNGLDSGLPLRPCDFLSSLSAGSPGIDPTLKPEGGDASKNLLRHWKNKQRKLDEYWSRWHTEYLLSLRQRHDRRHKNSRCAVKSTPAIDEIVLVKTEDAPRGTWKLARIVKLLHGNDDAIRAAELILPNGHTIRRPINHLYSVEIPAYKDAKTNDCEEENATQENDSESSFFGFDQSSIDEAVQLKRRLEEVEENGNLSAIICHSSRHLLKGLKNEEVLEAMCGHESD